MTLVWLVLTCIFGGALAFVAEAVAKRAPFAVGLATFAVAAALLWQLYAGGVQDSGFYATFSAPWIPTLGAAFRFALDGVSLLLVALAIAVGVVALVASLRDITHRTGLFTACVLWTVAGAIGVFVTFDLLLFFLFWEAMLIPMVVIIALWGMEARGAAAMRFFLFTQISGLAMLVAIGALAYAGYRSFGVWSFDYFLLRELRLEPGLGTLIMLGFFVAFVVKLPAVPFHTWLPDTYTQAPTGGSILLAGILSKMGGYGLLRYVLALFPEANALTGVAMALGAATVVYGGLLAFAQTDFKRIVAYSSVAHMGFVLFGVFAWSEVAVQGVIVQMLAHGLSTAGLFLLAGVVCRQAQTRDIAMLGGVWVRAPRLGAIGLFFLAAALGMPGLGNFVGEFLVLLGGFQVNALLTAIAAVGLVLSAMYALALMQRAFQGDPPPNARGLADLGVVDLSVLLPVMAALIALGIYVQPVLDLAAPAVRALPGLGLAP